MGEGKFEQKALVKAVNIAIAETAKVNAEMRVTTPGGRFHVRWDESSSASALGQLAFFAEFLETTGLFERWSEACPMRYTSPNAPKVSARRLRYSSCFSEVIPSNESPHLNA